MKKSFSVIIPCYNTEKYIAKAIDSIINQDYDLNLIQVLVIDDGSTTDAIEKIVLEYQKKYPMIEYFKKENNNWGSVINYAKHKQLVKNDIVSILDSDDQLKLNAFKVINKTIKDYDLFAGSFRFWRKNRPGQYVPSYYYPFRRVLTCRIQKQTPICLPIIFFYTKKIFYELKDLREKVPYQDFDYTSQILDKAKQMVFSYKVVAYYYDAREGNTITMPWDEVRFELKRIACLELIDADLQELASFRMTQKKMRELAKKFNVKYPIKRRFTFKWLPLGTRFSYWLIFFFTQRKFFKYEKPIKKEQK
ncbi:MAG: glycosyltransferase family 2 protein [Mycoplasmoidaceae bacterium]